VSDPVVLTGLAPVARRDARVLILGSMPGAASLAARRYYAHPANAFWPLLGAVLGCEMPRAYAARCTLLRARGIALWDVVHRCQRAGSLDAAIERASVEANAIGDFLARHRRVARLFFNGAAAESLFRRHVLDALDGRSASIARERLPSSSPANASWSFERKLAAWRAVGQVLGDAR